MKPRLQGAKLLFFLVGILGPWSDVTSAEPPKECPVDGAGAYKFSQEGLGEAKKEFPPCDELATALAPTWCEVQWSKEGEPPLLGPPPFLVFGRSDEVCIRKGNENLYYASSLCGPGGHTCQENKCDERTTITLPRSWNGQTTTEYPRAYFHAGVGAWQVDTASTDFRRLAAFEAVTPQTVLSVIKNKKVPWNRWVACRRCVAYCDPTNTTKRTECCKYVQGHISKNGATGDNGVSFNGGMVKWRCLWNRQDINCWWVDPALAEPKATGWSYGEPEGGDPRSPLTAPFLNFKAPGSEGTTTEYRVWPRIATGYDIDIYAARPLDKDARSGLKWGRGLPEDLGIPALGIPARGTGQEETGVDLVLLIDTTGSMKDDIVEVRNAAERITKDLFERGGDKVRVALAEYKDFPRKDYPSGEPNDFPYRAIVPFTEDKDKGRLLNAIKGLPDRVGGGGDIPESVYFAIVSAIRARCLGVWRERVRRVIVVMGDAPPHDPEPFTEFTGAAVAGMCLDSSAGAPVERLFEKYGCDGSARDVLPGFRREGGQQADPQEKAQHSAPGGFPADGVDARDDEETEDRLRAYQEWLALQPPRWENAWLAVDRLTPTSALLRWPAAQDEDTDVTGYRVFVDAVEVATVPGDNRSYVVTGLAPGRSYRFSVEARDANGNWSEDGPQLEATTPLNGVVEDSESPLWVDGSLTVTEVTQNSVRLEWRGALDIGTGVIAYRIFRDGGVILEVEASREWAVVTGLASGTFYSFTVQAGDALGHWSTTGPSVTIRTEVDPEPGWLTRIYTLVIGDRAEAVQAFAELSERTLAKPFQAEGASDVVDSILEVIEHAVDTTPPTLFLPGEVRIQATSTEGAVVTFTATATDDVSGEVSVACNPQSGTVFPVGQTVVTCRASDAAGNMVEGSFTVTVTALPDTPTATHTFTPTQTPTPSSERCSFVWENRHEMPSARAFTVAVVEGGKIYVVGGASSPIREQFRNEVATVEVYDPATDQWERLPDMLIGRAGPAAAALNGKIYVFGGLNGPLTGSPNRSAEVYDIERREWRRIADMPTGRSWMGAAEVGGKIYVIGGMGYGYRREVQAYDPTTNRWESRKALPSRERYLHAVVQSEGKIYVIGGESWQYGSQEIWADVWEYDPLADRWRERSSMPSPATGLHAVAWGGKIYVTGDRWVRVYDIASDQWQEWSSDHLGDGSSSLAFWNGWMYLFGGGAWGPTLNITQRSTLSCPKSTPLSPTSTPTPTRGGTPTHSNRCVGDCDGNGTVTIENLITMVNVALQLATVESCSAGDVDGDGGITMDEIVRAVNVALSGC